MAVANFDPTIQQWAMFTRLYVEALLVDPELADRVWELWDTGGITDDLAAWLWQLIVSSRGQMPIVT